MAVIFTNFRDLISVIKTEGFITAAEHSNPTFLQYFIFKNLAL